jgi:hypothetical protein
MSIQVCNDGITSSTGTVTIEGDKGIRLPSGTTAQRPNPAETGTQRYNTDTGSIEFFDGANWISTNLIPSIDSISGTIYAGFASDLTLNLTNATDVIDVKYYENGTLLATDSGVTVTSGSATSTVPSAVYGQTAGDTITIQIFNQDGTPSSNTSNKTVQGLPTGGTITTSGSYRYHKFTSSGTFTVPSGYAGNVEYVVVAGGGAGGGNQGGGGGGAGGLITGTQYYSSGSYSVTIGGGGAAATTTDSPSAARIGSNSVLAAGSTVTALGGGGGRQTHGPTQPADPYISGGSGGGGTGRSSTVGGSGTSGQGYPGGRTTSGTSPSDVDAGGGGGGKASAGANSPGNYVGGAGGSGVNLSTWATATSSGDGGYYAGGGGGGTELTSGSAGSGGAGGGGDGGFGSSTTPQNGSTNTGGGGGGYGNTGFASGGSGIVLLRYQPS